MQLSTLSSLNASLKRKGEEAQNNAKRPPIGAFPFTDSGPIPFVECREKLPSLAARTDLIYGHFKQLVMEVQLYLQKEDAREICKCIVMFKPGTHYHHKKEGDEFSYFIIKTELVAYACISTQSAIDEGGQSKVSSARLLEFAYQEGKILLKGATEAVKHTTPCNKLNVSNQYAAHKALRNHPHVATPYFYALYQGKRGERILQVYPRFQGTMHTIPFRMNINRVWFQLGSALHAVHKAGYVHRDLKPGNIFVNWDQAGLKKLVLGDFGLCCPSQDPELKNSRGTLNYCAPEIAIRMIRKEAKKRGLLDLYAQLKKYLLLLKVTPAVDMWSLGLLLYETWTGNPHLFTSLLKNVGEAKNMLKNKDLVADAKKAALQSFVDKTQVWIQWLDKLLETEKTALPVSSFLLENFIIRSVSVDPTKRPTYDQLQAFIAALAPVSEDNPLSAPATAARP